MITRSSFASGHAAQRRSANAESQRRGARNGSVIWQSVSWFATLLFLVTPALLGAQEATRVSALETERLLQFEEAQSLYDGALAARAAAEARFQRIAQELEDARNADDEERRNAALAQAQLLTNDMLALDARVAETGTALEDARGRYLEILDIQLDFLVQGIEFASTAADSAQLGALYRERSARFTEVERGRRSTVELAAVVMPEITATPRDGPRELRVKADLLERRAEQADSTIAYIDLELVDLERRARRDRGMQALQRGVERFDDTRVPVQPRSQADDGAQQIAETPEERMDSLRRLRAYFVDRRAEAIRRAQEFRDMAGPGGAA